MGTGPPVQVGHDVVPVSKLWLLRLPVVLNILAEGVDEAEELSSHWGKLDKRGQLLIGAVGRQVTWVKDSFGAIFIWISSAISFDFSSKLNLEDLPSAPHTRHCIAGILQLVNTAWPTNVFH